MHFMYRKSYMHLKLYILVPCLHHWSNWFKMYIIYMIVHFNMRFNYIFAWRFPLVFRRESVVTPFHCCNHYCQPSGYHPPKTWMKNTQNCFEKSTKKFPKILWKISWPTSAKEKKCLIKIFSEYFWRLATLPKCKQIMSIVYTGCAIFSFRFFKYWSLKILLKCLKISRRKSCEIVAQIFTCFVLTSLDSPFPSSAMAFRYANSILKIIVVTILFSKNYMSKSLPSDSVNLNI